MANTGATRELSRKRRFVYTFIAFAISCSIGFLLLEGGLRLARSPDRFLPYHRNSVKIFYPNDEITPGVTGITRFSTNSFGTRGPEPADEKIRILTAGGSTTACTVLDDTETWPRLLETYLKEDAGDPSFAWVTNSGTDGHNSHHHLMHVTYLLPQLPEMDYVIIYAGLNDVGQWIYHADYNPDYLETEAGWNARLGEAFRVSNYTDPTLPIYKRLEIWKRTSILKSLWESRVAVDQLADGAIVQDEQLRWIEQERAHRAAVEKVNVHRAKMETLPDALDSYGRTLTRIVETVRQNGAEPILVAQAIQHLFLNAEERERLWMGRMDGGKTYIREEQMYELLLKYNARMEEVAGTEDVLFIDLPSLIGGQGALFYDGSHFNENGARVTARALATYLEEHLFKPQGFSFKPPGDSRTAP